MKKITKRFLASLMVAVMVLSSAPLSGIAMLDWASVFATISSALSKSEEPVNASSDMTCDFIQYVDIDNKDTELKHSRLNVASSRPRRMLAANKNSDNPNTYTVLLLDKEASHNLTSGGTYICTLGSPVENVKAAALKLIDQIRLTRGTTHVAIVTFDSSVQVVQNFTTDYTIMRNSIDKISSGSTWANVNGAYQKADELLSAVTDNSADKNIVLFSQGLAYAGDHTPNGIYSEEDCNWYRADTNIHAYEYSNSAYATAQSLMSKYNIYSIGLYQSFDTVPEEGQSLLSFALSFAEDVQNSGFYSINDINDLEFNLAQEIFNLAVAIDPDKIFIPVMAQNSNNEYVDVTSAKVSIIYCGKVLESKLTNSDGVASFSKNELIAKAGDGSSLLELASVVAEKSIGNDFYLVSDYYQCNYSRLSEFNNGSNHLLLSFCQFKPKISIAYQSTNNQTESSVKSVLNTYINFFQQLTYGRVKVEVDSIEEHKTATGVRTSGADILIYSHYDKNTATRANLNGYKKFDCHIYTAFTSDRDSGFEAATLCHESMHYFFGVYDEYCCGYRIKNKNYDIDFNGHNGIEKNPYNVFWTRYENDIPDGAKKIKNTKYLQAKKNEYNKMLPDGIRINNSGVNEGYICYSSGNITNDSNNQRLDFIIEENGAYWGFVFDKPSVSSFGIMDDNDLFVSTASTYNYLAMQDYGGSLDYNENNIQYYTDQYCSEKKSVSDSIDSFFEKKSNDNNYSITSYSMSHSTPDHVFQEQIEDDFIIDKYDDSIKNDSLNNSSFTNSEIYHITWEKNNSDILMHLESSDTINAIVVVDYKDSNEPKEYRIDSLAQNDSIILSDYINISTVYVISENNEFNEYDFELFSGELSDNTCVSFLQTVSTQPELANKILIISNKNRYETQGFFSLERNFQIICINGLIENSDEDYSLTTTLSKTNNVNFSTVQFYKRGADNTFTPMETSGVSGEDTNEQYYSFSFDNEGEYILMAENSTNSAYNAITDLSIDMESTTYEKELHIKFNDSNEASHVLYYKLYFSTSPINTNLENTDYDILSPGKEDYTIYFQNEYGKYYFAMEVVGVDGGTSTLSNLVCINIKVYDSDFDGIPDCWVNQFVGLSELEDIPNSDPDNDGLDNLTEYQYGTNPLCPDTDGDNVYDKIELLKDLDPLKPKTDGETDDYIVAYGTPELKLTNLHFDERYVYFSVENDTDSKAMRTVVDVRSGDSTIALWTVNIDGRSVIDFAVEKGMLSGLDEFTISVDEGMITRDSDYSNNTFDYSASTSITLNDIDVVKNTAENLVPVVSPETANEIYRYTLIDGSCITLDEINGSIFADKIGQAHIQVESLSGNADTCLVSVISFEGAEYSEFECLKINETEVAITGYYGESTSVEIPESIGEFTVTAINSRAFNNIDVESVSIPDSVSEISATAFYVNNTINSFIVDENNPVYCSDDGVIYNKDKTTLVAYPPAKSAETFDIPDTVTCIGSYAFNYNTFLTSISIDNGITEIGSCAFYQCSSLNAINIDSSVTNIGTYAFYGCTNLSEAAYSGDINDWCKITFSSMYSNPSYYTNGIKINGQPILGEIEISSNVGAYSLYNFTDITKVTVSDGVETIGKYAFRNCNNLKDVIISNSVSSIQNGAFRDCNKIENMSIPFVGESRTAIEMNSVFGYIFDYVLLGTGTVRQYYSGSILGYGYYIPSSIKTVTITDATKIPYGAFYNCSSITDIIINDSVTNMGEKCFANCNGLVNLTIPFVGESRTATGINGVFGYFFNSSDTSDDNTVTQYYESSGSKYYYIPTSIESITITDAEQLPYGAFYNCSMLKNISLNQKITDIGSSAFSGCSSLENTYYTGTIESWCTTNFMSSSSCPNYYAKHFYLNGELLTGELIIPDSVTDISSYSFYNFKDLESIKFSNTLQSVGTSTFYGCSGLKKVEYEGTIDDWYGLSFDNYASNPNYYAQNLLISGEPVEGRIVMPDGLEKVPNVVFAGCKDITEVVISESATSIGKSAFDRCSGLENIVIPENVTLIDQNAFCDCSSLKNLIVPCSVKYSSNGFKNCNNIEEITITKGDGTMPNLISLSLLSNYYGYTPWYTSNSIERIVIEDGVEIIGNYEFRSTSASEIIIPDSVKSIGTYAFYDNSNLNKLTVPNSVETISSKAFSSNTVIYCYNNSAAHLYAKENSLNYILLDCIYAIEGSLLTIDNDLKLISGFVNGIDALYSELNVSEGSTIFFDKSVEKVYTGMPIQVLDKNGNILSDYAAVIIGDVTGDGNYDGMDSIIVSSIVNGMLTKTDVGEAVYMAADCNRDGQITQSDVDLLTYAGVYEYDVRQVSSEKSQKADVLFANEFDFDSFGFSYSCYGGQIEDIDYENNSVIIKSESNDCYMNPWYGADNSMNLIPGHKYRIKYTAENLSDSLAIPSVLLFARNSEDSTDIDNIEYMFTELDAGQKTVFEKLYTVPENRPFVKVRLGNGAPSTVRISDIEIQDITNPYNTEETFSLPNIYGKECSIVTVNKGTSFSDFSEFLPQIYNNGYYISGWYTEKNLDGNGTGEEFKDNTIITANIKLYPGWKKLSSPVKAFETEYYCSSKSDFITYLATAWKSNSVFGANSKREETKKLLSAEGYIPIDKDMNDGTRGDHIYIGYKTGSNIKDAARCIMVYSGTEENRETIKYQTINGYNCAFTIVGKYPSSDEDDIVDGIVDLNKGIDGSNYIYLYVSKDPHAGPPITEFTWDSSSEKDGWVPVCGTSDSTHDVNVAADMNRMGKGDDIVLFYKSNAIEIDSDDLRNNYSDAKIYLDNHGVYTDESIASLIEACLNAEKCLDELNSCGATTFSQEEIDQFSSKLELAISSLEKMTFQVTPK